MGGLRLDALNLTQQSTHHHDSHLVHNPGDCHTHMALNIPEVRGWLRDQFCTLSLGQIDQPRSKQSSRTSHPESSTLNMRQADPTDDVLIDSCDWRSVFRGITHPNSYPSRCRYGREVGFQARYTFTVCYYL
jgi:hypothetical protein